jgi:uncharacterized protein YgbK (DUF1537 family)
MPIIGFETGLVEKGQWEAAVDRAYEKAAAQLKEGAPPVCLIAVDSMFHKSIRSGEVNRSNNEAMGAEIAAALGCLTSRLLADFNFAATFATGGDVSVAICKKLGAIGIEPLTEICPGIPMGAFLGGSQDGHLVITKSGRFGTAGSLLEILHYIGGNHD